MKVTNVKITMAKPGSKIKAFADITFDEVMTTKGWKVINGQNGLFVTPPSQKNGEKYYDNILFVGADKKGSLGDRAKTYVANEVLKIYNSQAQSASEGQSFNQTRQDDDVPF